MSTGILCNVEFIVSLNQSKGSHGKLCNVEYIVNLTQSKGSQAHTHSG